ncbi:MAG: amino acid permease [Gammaproteobacteria bacterium]|nr:amino acid permease [Gammaproteobacteria bacterium]
MTRTRIITTPEKEKMGLWMLTALVAGNMIGSGVFLLPADLAKIGSISLYGWLFTTLGAFTLAILFAKMSLWIPKAGGPYAYAEKVLGRYMGFQTAYSYWVAIWVGNAAMSLATIGYLRVFFPILANPLLACLVAIIQIWLLTFVNLQGVKTVGIIQLATTVGKLFPILLIGIVGWAYFHPHYFTAGFHVSSQSHFHAISSAASLTLWAFIGVESAAVSSDTVKSPHRNVPLATLLGTAIAAVAYISSSTAMMGMLPHTALANSTAPFALAASQILGPWGHALVAIAAVISCLGALNGWILLQGEIPKDAAVDQLFPALFSRCNRHGVPAVGLMITSLLISGLLLCTMSEALTQQTKQVLFCNFPSTLLPHFSCSYKFSLESMIH